jgi:hypothetical protein
MRHHLESPTKSPPGPHRVSRDTLDAALLARKQTYQQVGLFERPGPQDNRFTLPLCHPVHPKEKTRG